MAVANVRVETNCFFPPNHFNKDVPLMTAPLSSEVEPVLNVPQQNKFDDPVVLKEPGTLNR